MSKTSNDEPSTLATVIAGVVFIAVVLGMIWAKVATTDDEPQHKDSGTAHVAEPKVEYDHQIVDATGRIKGDLNENDEYDYWDIIHDNWRKYGDEIVDDKHHMISQPMLNVGEIKWLKKHPRMPRIAPGTPLDDLGIAPPGAREPFPEAPIVGGADLNRIIDVTVLNPEKRKKPRRFITRETTPIHADLFAHDAQNTSPYTDGGDWELRVVRTIPAAGERINVYKGVMIITRWTYEAYDWDSDGIINAEDDTPTGSVSGSYSSGDDSYNIPGWLCPTRFC